MSFFITFEQKLIAWGKIYAPKCTHVFINYRQKILYLFSGGISAVVDVSVLYILTDIAGLWYLLSTVIGFLCGLTVSFFLQKFLTFRDPRMEVIAIQALWAFIYLSALNLFANVVLMYVLVDVIGWGYIYSRIIIGIAAAFASYFIYKILIFGKKY